jgi:hypothetical protein
MTLLATPRSATSPSTSHEDSWNRPTFSFQELLVRRSSPIHGRLAFYANLNDIFNQQGKYIGKGTLFDGELADLCEAMQYYAAPILICTAHHDRWGIKELEYNIVAKDVRNRCCMAGIACKQGREFWESLRPWATMMGGMHHKDGGWRSLAWCWDREFVRTSVIKISGVEGRHKLKLLLDQVKLAEVPIMVPQVVVSPKVRVEGAGSAPVRVFYKEPDATVEEEVGLSGSTAADPIEIPIMQVPRGLNPGHQTAC